MRALEAFCGACDLCGPRDANSHCIAQLGRSVKGKDCVRGQRAGARKHIAAHGCRVNAIAHTSNNDASINSSKMGAEVYETLNG